MAFRFFDLFRKDAPATKVEEIQIRELVEAGQEFQIRQLCFWTCVNMIANSIGRCEMKTYRKNAEIQEKEYWMWNVEPNRNQNSSEFWHKAVAKLYMDNEVLIVEEPYGKGVVVADKWDVDDSGPTNWYTGVTVGKREIGRRLKESDVMRIKLNHKRMAPVIEAMNDSYLRLVRAAMNNYLFNNGQHWKVAIDRVAQGNDDFTKSFTEMIEKQVKPFLESERSVLPQFDGYKYERLTGGTDSRSDTKDVRELITEMFEENARGFLIPAVLVNGKVEGTADANSRYLTNVIDPIADQITEEANRKRVGFDGWMNGERLRMDTSSILHFDMFANAVNVEKLIGSGAWSVNEIRKAAGDAPINEPWADQHFLTLNISTMAEAVQKSAERR